MTRHHRHTARRSRVAAAWVVAGASTVVAAVAHGLAGGGFPNHVALLLALTSSGFIGMLIVSGRMTRVSVAAAVVVDQAIFHGLYSTIGATTAPGVSSAMPGAPASGHTLHGLGSLDSAVSPLNDHTVAMGAHHLAAAIIAYGMLRLGLSAISTALASLALRLLISMPVVTAMAVDAPASPLIDSGSEAAPALPITTADVSRRGPPQFVLAA